MVFPWFSMVFHGFPMVFHGILIGNAMVFPWIFRGTSSDRCSLGSKLLGATVSVPVDDDVSTVCIHMLSYMFMSCIHV